MKTKKGIGIIGRLIVMAALPALVLGSCLSVLSKHLMENAMEEQVLVQLQSVAGSCLYYAQDYAADLNDENRESLQAYCDEIKAQTSVQLTIFAGDTRYATSIRDENGDPLIGTTASDQVVQTVINGGKDYSTDDVMINGEAYYGYYIPLTDGSSGVVGMVFAGQTVSYVNEVVSSKTTTLTLISTVLFLIIMASSVFFSRKLGKIITESVKYVTILSEGKLRFEMDEKVCSRADELGELKPVYWQVKDGARRACERHQAILLLAGRGVG